MGLALLSGVRGAMAEQPARAAKVGSRGYLSKIIVTGPSFVSATSIIAPKEPVFTDRTPAVRSLSQK
jgi:hypothetical protein